MHSQVQSCSPNHPVWSHGKGFGFPASVAEGGDLPRLSNAGWAAASNRDAAYGRGRGHTAPGSLRAGLEVLRRGFGPALLCPGGTSAEAEHPALLVPGERQADRLHQVIDRDVTGLASSQDRL